MTAVAIGVAACGGPTENAENATRATTAAPAVASARPLTAGWTTTDGIKAPTSVYYEPTSGFIYSSQMNGAPDGRDGNGRIAKLDGDGSVINASFVTGLDAPKVDGASNTLVHFCMTQFLSA